MEHIAPDQADNVATSGAEIAGFRSQGFSDLGRCFVAERAIVPWFFFGGRRFYCQWAVSLGGLLRNFTGLVVAAMGRSYGANHSVGAAHGRDNHFNRTVKARPVANRAPPAGFGPAPLNGRHHCTTLIAVFE